MTVEFLWPFYVVKTKFKVTHPREYNLTCFLFLMSMFICCKSRYIAKHVMTGLSVHVIIFFILFYSSYHGDTKTNFSEKFPSQIQARYLDIHMLDF